MNQLTRNMQPQFAGIGNLDEMGSTADKIEDWYKAVKKSTKKQDAVGSGIHIRGGVEEQVIGKIDGGIEVVGKVSDDVAKGVSKAEPFDIVKYGDKTPGLENHHGVLDVWAKNNIPGYVERAKDSTSIALTAGKEGQHAATKAVYRDWLFEKTGKKVGGKIDWKDISPREMQDLTERMLDASGVPESARREYYREFHKYIYGLD